MKRQSGISLIVLVITIIIMVIIAGTIILSLEDSGIIGKASEAVNTANEKEVQQLVAVLWAEAFTDGKRTQSEIEAYVLAELAKHKISTTEYAVNVTTGGATAYYIPEAWRDTVSTIVDTVPIPKGFVASKATGENDKEHGLVIYEGTQTVDDTNVETARRTRNQYVWVPVPSGDFVTKFVRQDYNTTKTYNVLGTGYWEVVVDESNNIPLPNQSASYITNTTQTGNTTNTLAEVQAMYASVKEYEGFYIARYEAGIDNYRHTNDGVLESNVYSMMGKIPYVSIPWGTSMTNDSNGAVQVARRIYPVTNTNYGVVSTLAYGVQWDTTLEWWLDTKAVTDIYDSTEYSNCVTHVINPGDLNSGAQYKLYGGTTSFQEATATSTKDNTTRWTLTTGALKAAKVNNIYDMAGNVWEWTMEGGNIDKHILRGGNFYSTAVAAPVSDRAAYTPETAANHYGFRVALYMK